VAQAEPMILPARRYVYPRAVAGEEDALARGAMKLRVRPRAGGEFWAVCARGFADAAAPTGVFACPNADEMCAVAGGYAYVVNTMRPEECRQVELRPVMAVRAAVEDGLLLFAGTQRLVAWGAEGERWMTARISDEGVRIAGVENGVARVVVWRLRTDREEEIRVSLVDGSVLAD